MDRRLIMDKKWEQMTAEERQEAMYQRWASPVDPEGNPLKFNSGRAEKLFNERYTRVKDAIQMKREPDRIPVWVTPNMWPVNYAGYKIRDVITDYTKVAESFKKFVFDFDMDMHMGCVGPGSARFYELMDYKLYKWAGQGVGEDSSYQAVEGEYMKEDEYDALINDPTDFFIHTYLPRVFGVLNPGFNMLPTFTGILEIYGVPVNFLPFATPHVQNAFKALSEAGAEAMKWAEVVFGFNYEMAAAGYPAMLAGYSKVPFDTLGDTLRGMRAIMMDMYRRPDKVLKAIERLTPIMIKMGVNTAKMTGFPLIFIPLHKGADGFMSDEQFKKFYWPGFKELINGLIDGGCIPMPWVEGSWSSRLKVMKEIPKGKTLWMFDQQDMVKAKEIMGGVACIGGNMPSSLLSFGNVQEIKDYTKKLIDTCGKGGGYIMCNGAFFDHAKSENIKAMVDFTKEYGVYK
jgi:uroporphyrinogen-III decarboxylase